MQLQKKLLELFFKKNKKGQRCQCAEGKNNGENVTDIFDEKNLDGINEKEEK